MNVQNPYVAIAPVILLVVAAVFGLVLISIRRNHLTIFALTIMSLATAMGGLVAIWRAALRSTLVESSGKVVGTSFSSALPVKIGTLFVMDSYSLFFMALTFAATGAVAMMSHGYLEKRPQRREEYYILLLLAAVGSAAVVASCHFASFFMGLEVLSVSLYTLIAYHRRTPLDTEAGLKYLVLAAVSASFLLFGMALLYLAGGSMHIGEMAARLSAAAGAERMFVMIGVAMMIVGIGFKLAVVPFHLWTPDIYQAAPAPITAFVATVSKGAIFVLLMRYFNEWNLLARDSVTIVFTVIAAVSMFAGNLLALLQNNVKRILAYSSIAHLGYLLVAFLASRGVAQEKADGLAVVASSYYLLAYYITTLGAFGVVSMLSAGDRDADDIDDYRGLAYRRPWLAGVFVVMLLSLAGIPLTAGFLGKFYVVLSGVKSHLWTLVILLAINSTIGVFYYLRIVMIMFSRLGEATWPASPLESPVEKSPSLATPGAVALAVLSLLLIGLGTFPAPMLRLMDLLKAFP